MTRETQTAFAPAAQIVFKRGAGARSVAGYAVHGCAGARVNGVFPDGMGEGAVFSMTGITRLGEAIAQHVGLVGTVPGMAVAAAVRLRMHMQGALAPL